MMFTMSVFIEWNAGLTRVVFSYAEELSEEVKARYKDNIALVGGIDSYGKVSTGDLYAVALLVDTYDFTVNILWIYYTKRTTMPSPFQFSILIC